VRTGEPSPPVDTTTRHLDVEFHESNGSTVLPRNAELTVQDVGNVGLHPSGSRAHSLTGSHSSFVRDHGDTKRYDREREKEKEILSGQNANEPHEPTDPGQILSHAGTRPDLSTADTDLPSQVSVADQGEGTPQDDAQARAKVKISISLPGQDPTSPAQDDDAAYWDDEETEQDSLGSKIRVAMEHSTLNKDRRFMPLNDLDKIITKDNARHELALHSEIPVESLDMVRDEICNITSPSADPTKRTTRRKIFAILVLIDRVPSILDFIKEGIYDSDLPFILKDGPKPGTHRLYRKVRKTLQPIPIFRNWKHVFLEAFDNNQWRFLAPNFSLSGGKQTKVCHYELEDRIILPWIEDMEYKVIAAGGYGEVWRVKIHPAHHDGCEPGVSFTFVHRVRRHHSRTLLT
jgi:hypothetical protein